MIVVGLTGSIGMGKSTTARMFAEEGVPVFDSDATVHNLYAGEAAALVDAAFPGTVIEGQVDRGRLSEAVVDDPQARQRLEAIIHPLVRARSDAFLARHRAQGTPLVVLDIPLLFETGAEERVDRIVVVSASPKIQEERVLARPGMSRDKFSAIRAAQVPDHEKRNRADFVIDTGRGISAARNQVHEIITKLVEGEAEAP